VLPGQGYQTSEGALFDEYGLMVEMKFAGNQPKKLGENLNPVPLLPPRISGKSP
jgi:hypothetical protein